MGEETDEGELNVKKTREEEEEVSEEKEVSEEEEEVSEEEPTPTQPEKVTKQSLRGKGRSRGKRSIKGVTRSDPPPPAEVPIAEDKEETKIGKIKNMEDMGTDNEELPVKDTLSKKRRGRPKRKWKEEPTLTHSISSDTPSSQSPSIKMEDGGDEEVVAPSLSLSEPVVHPDQIVQLLQLSENVESGNLNDNIPPSTCTDERESNTSVITSTSTSVMTTVTSVDNKETLKDNFTVTSLTTPTTSQTPPTNIPVESGYPFPRYSLEEQGYSHSYPPPHPIHHSFLPPSYPPFSAPPYHTFMIPTSPHFYPPPPQDCLPPPAIYFSDDPFNRYPPQTTAAVVTQVNNEKVISLTNYCKLLTINEFLDFVSIRRTICDHTH